jgi:hypothetical protein
MPGGEQDHDDDGAKDLDALKDQRGAATIDPVRDDPSCQDQQPDGRVAHERIDAEEEWGVGQAQHQPRLRHLLHPSSRIREQVPEPEQREVTGAHRTQCTAW